MHLIVYGDFNCPYSCLASQRVDELTRSGAAEVEWRAVEHDPTLALTGTPRSLDAERWQRELAELALLADEDEQAPGVAPSVISNTGAAVAAYAEAVTDGVEDDLRRSLFSEIWVNRRHLSGPYGVRQLVCTLMYPAGTRSGQLAAPDLPSRIHGRAATGTLPAPVRVHDQPRWGAPDRRGVRSGSGGGGTGWRSGADGMVPALSLPDGMLTGVPALYPPGRAGRQDAGGHQAAGRRRPLIAAPAPCSAAGASAGGDGEAGVGVHR
jgi:hypothetical protein